MSEETKEENIGWGFQSFTCSHLIQKVAMEFETTWKNLSKWKIDENSFQGKTKEDLVNMASTYVHEWSRCLRMANELPDDGKKPSDFPPIVDTTEETLKEFNRTGEFRGLGLTRNDSYESLPKI